jgi:hypothetical protein
MPDRLCVIQNLGVFVMANGIYLVSYTGIAGFGAASCVFLNGEIFGADVTGGEYHGSYKVADGRVAGVINLHVPANVQLVTGALSDMPYTIPIDFTIPAGMRDQQTVQITVKLPTGAVNANIKKVKTLPA